ncbi:hypothetical protein K1719_003462 [Acacia pycnantha]|nr:hypothetical protein K1719_003462 [Acacia pycnantha]
MATYHCIKLLLSFLVYLLCETVSTQHIPLGCSLSLTVPPTSWPSPSGRFAFSFYQQGNGLFKLGIWLFDRIKKTVVWTANRDDPPVSSNAGLVLTINGELLLQTGPGQKKSFDQPADTMLRGSNSTRLNWCLVHQKQANLLEGFYSPCKLMETLFCIHDILITKVEIFTGPLILILTQVSNNTNPEPLCIVNGTSSKSKYLGKWVIAASEETTLFIGKLLILMEFYDSAHFDDANGIHQVLELWSPEELENLCNVKSFCGFNS